MTDANANIQINGSVAPIINAELNKLQSELGKTISALQRFNTSNKSLVGGTDAVGIALGRISKSLKDTSHSIQQIDIQQSALAAGFQRNTKIIAATADQIKILEAANRSLNKNGVKYDTGPLIAYQKQLQAINGSSKSISNANHAASLKKIGSSYEAMSQKINYASQRLTFGLSLPIGAFLRTGFNSLKSMSTQTVRLSKLLDDAYSSTKNVGQSQSDLDKALKTIGKSLDDLSGKWGVSRELLQGVVGDFAEIGISSTSALAVLTQTTVEFEKLGNVDISQAGETVRNLYQNMARIRRDKGLGVTSSKDIEEMMAEVRGAVALFNYAENKTSLSLKNMADAFPEVSAAATSFGLDIATTSALLVPMIGAGIKTGTAANSIKISLQGLVNITKKAGMDLAAVNKFFGTDIAIGGEIGAAGIQKLANAYTLLKAKTGDAQTLATFGDFFGKRQAPRFEISIQQASQFTEKIKDASSAEAKLLGGLESTINASLKLNGLKAVQLKDIKDINDLTKAAQERDGSGNFTARARFIQEAQAKQVKNLTEQKTLGTAINNISTEYGKIQVAGAFGSALTGQTLKDELKKAEQSLEVKYGKARENIKSISRELTTVLADILNVLNPIIKAVTKWVQGLSAPIKKLVGVALVFAALLGPTLRTVGALFQLTGSFAKMRGAAVDFKSLGKSTTELNKDLIRTNDIVFRLGGKFRAFGEKGSIFTDKGNVKSIKKLTAIQQKEDSGENLTRSDKADKKKALIKLTGREAVRKGTALSATRDMSGVDMQTQASLEKIYEPQEQVKKVVAEAMAKAEADAAKVKKKGKRKSAVDDLVPRDVPSSRTVPQDSSTAATVPTPATPAVPAASTVRMSTPTPAANVYEGILNNILTVLKAIEGCACAGKTAMTGPSNPPASGPTASPRGPTPVAPAGGSTATPAPSSSPALSKKSDEELAAGKESLENKPEVVKPKRTRNPQVKKDENKAVNERADDIEKTAAELVTKEEEPESKKGRGPGKTTGPKAKIFGPVEKFADKLGKEKLELLKQAGVVEATSAQGVGVAFDLTKQNIINLFEALGKEVPEGLKKITQIVDKATGEAIRITPSSLAKIKTSIESGKLQSLVNEGKGSTGNRSLDESIRGATGTAKRRTNTSVTYDSIRSGRDPDKEGHTATALSTGNVGPQESPAYYKTLFKTLKELSIDVNATEEDLKNLDIKFKVFLETLKNIEKVNEGSLIPNIKNPAQLSDAMEDTVRGSGSRIAKFGKANSSRAKSVDITEQQLQGSLGTPVGKELRVDRRVQSSLEAGFPKNRNFYQVKRQEYSLNDPAGAERVSSGESTKDKTFGYGPLSGMVKKPLDKLTDSQYEKFSASRKTMIENARESMRVKSEDVDPFDEALDFTKGAIPLTSQPERTRGKKSERVISDDEVQNKINKRNKEIDDEGYNQKLAKKLKERSERSIRENASRLNEQNKGTADKKAAKVKDVDDTTPAESVDDYIKRKRKEESKRRNAEKPAKPSGGGGTAGGTSFGGVDDPFTATMGGPRVRGPRMAKIPGLAFVDKGAITGGVTNVYEEIRQSLGIPVKVMNEVIAQLKEKHNVITTVGTTAKTAINGNLNGVVEAIRGTLGTADMTVENVKAAIVAQRGKIGDLRGGAKASATGGSPKASESGLIGSGMGRDDRMKYAQELKSKIIAEGKASVDFQNHELKTLEYIARAFRKGAKGSKAQLEQIIVEELKTLGITVDKVITEETVKPIQKAKNAVRPRSSRKPATAPAGSVPTPPPEDVVVKTGVVPTVGQVVPQLALGTGSGRRQMAKAKLAAAALGSVGETVIAIESALKAPLAIAEKSVSTIKRELAQAKLAAAALGSVGDTVRVVSPMLMLTEKVAESQKMIKARMRLQEAASGTSGDTPIEGQLGKPTTLKALGQKTKMRLRNLGADLGSHMGSRDIEQQKLPSKMLDILNPLRAIGKSITPKKIEYVSRALSGKAPTLEMRNTDIVTWEDQEQRQRLSDVYRQAKRGLIPTRRGIASATRASATKGLMAVGRGLQNTPLAPAFASAYQPYMPIAFQMKMGRGGKLRSTIAGQRPTTGMAGGAARQSVFQRYGIQNPQPASPGQREGLAKIFQGASLPSAFETGSVKLLSSIKKLSPVFDTAIQVAAKMVIESSKLPYTVAKVYGKAVVEAHKIAGQAIAIAYNTFKGSGFAQNNPIGKTLLSLATNIENAVKATSNAIKATINVIKNPDDLITKIGQNLWKASADFKELAKKSIGNFIRGKEIIDEAGNAKRKGGVFQPFRNVKEAISPKGRARGMAKLKGLGSSIGGGIQNAASQGISSLTVGLGPLGSIANGPLQKIVNLAFKFKKIAMGISIPLLLVVGTVMLLKATFGSFSDKAGNTMKNFQHVLKVIKSVVDKLKRAFFDFFASLFGPAKNSGQAMGNVGKKVESVSNIVARFANKFLHVFNKYILPAIYGMLSGLSLLIRGAMKIFGGIIKLVQGLVQKFTGQGDKAGKSFDKGLSMLKDGFYKVFKGLVKFLAIPLKLIINAIMKLVEYIVQLFEWVVIGVVNLIRYMVKGIINVSFTIVKAYVFIMDKVIELFVKLEKAAINIALATVKGVVNAFFGIIKAAVFIVQKVIDLFALIPAGVGKGFSLLTGLIAGLLRKIAEKLPNIFGIQKKINGVADAIEGAGDSAEEMGNKAKGALNGILDPVTKGLQSGQNAILDFIDKIGGAALSNIGKLGNLGDYILKVLGGAQNALLDGTDSVADKLNRLVGGTSDGINKLRKGIVDWIDDFASGDDIVKGIGDNMKKAVEKVVDEIADPQASIAAGKIIATGITKGLKDLKMNFYEKVTESLGNSLAKLKDGMKDALGKQKDQQLKFFDDQIAAIDALAAAEEELTAKKKFEEDKRDRNAERALQRDAYRKNRALAIYEGRVEDARTMSLQEEKDNKDFNKDIQSMDEDRKKNLQGQNRDAAKSAIERQKKEASDKFDIQIKNFEDLIENIGKYGTLSKDDLQAQFNALNDLSVTTSEDMKTAFEGYYKALPGIIQANTDPVVGFFTAGIDTLIAAAAGKYGIGQGVSDPATMLGLTNLMLTETGTAYTDGFANTIIPNYKTGQDAIAAIATDFADSSKPNSLAGIYKLAISNATDAITAEFVKMKTEASAAFAGVVKGINDELKNLAIGQAITDAKEQIAADNTNMNNGGTDPGTTSQGGQKSNKKFGPVGLTQTLFEAAAGKDKLFKLNDENDYIKSAKSALTFYGYSGFDITSAKMGKGTITALKKFQKDYPVAGNNSGNLGPSTAKALGLFGSSGVQKKYNGGMIKKMISGGVVPGFSNQGVPAILHGGEYVINSKAVQNLGLSVLAQLNGLKNGVPSINVPKPRIPNSSGMNMNITSHSQSETTQNYNFYVDNFIGEDQWFESMMKDYNIKVVPNNQKTAGLESRVIRTYNGINKGM